MTIINRPVTGATRTMKRIVPLLGFAVALLSMPAAADLVGLYTFDGANPLEAVIGSPAKEGVTTGNSVCAQASSPCRPRARLPSPTPAF